MATMQTPVETLPDIFYEDPEPVEDGMQQAIPLFDIVTLLHKHYADRSDVYVGGGGFPDVRPKGRQQAHRARLLHRL